MNTSALQQILNTTLDLTKQMMLCLDRENACLVTRQYQQLIETAEHKQQLAEQLEQQDLQRQQLAAGIPFEQYLMAQGDQSAQRCWEAIGYNVKLCAEKNQINGRLLQRQHQITQATIATITGRGDNSNRVYDANGQTSAQTSLLPNIEA
jgi:flagellar biosynthesis/type III secretory pathway chaperone